MIARPVKPRPVPRREWPQPVRDRRPRKRFRWLRRIAMALGLLAVCVVAAYVYLLVVYAPGLRSEARTIPARVNAQLAQHNAQYIPLSAISPNLQHAIVAIEDRRFYYHPGVDPLGMARALWVDLTEKHVDQGGSTLEEQLVKRTIVPDDRTFHAKLRTIALAWAVDQDFSKAKIIELYLNAAYYGQGAYGAAQAAQVYFGTDAAHISLPEAALLAALPQAPSIYGANPLADQVQHRKATVLSDMANMGYITSAQADAATRAPLHFAFPNP